MRVVPLRLRPGDDLRLALEAGETGVATTCATCPHCTTSTTIGTVFHKSRLCVEQAGSSCSRFIACTW